MPETNATLGTIWTLEMKVAPKQHLYQIELLSSSETIEAKIHSASKPHDPEALICGLDVGSTTCKYVLARRDGTVVAQAYERHQTKQGEKVFSFLRYLERTHGLRVGRDRVFFTGSGSGLLAPLVGGRVLQEVVALAASVQQLHPRVRFVSEIGGEDMKTVFFSGEGSVRSKQVFMQSACSGGTGTFIEKTARKLEITPEQLAQMHYSGVAVHKISSKCGIFAEADANTLLKSGAPVEEIIASVFEAVVYQNLATLTRGNTPQPEVLLLGGPNLFFAGLQEAWRFHLIKLWNERNIIQLKDCDPASLISVPENALYYAALGCVATAIEEPETSGLYNGLDRLDWWINEGQAEEKKNLGRGGLSKEAEELLAFRAKYNYVLDHATASKSRSQGCASQPFVVGCDFGSTTAKAVCLSPNRDILFSCYALSRGNPIEDAKHLFQQICEFANNNPIAALGITGYGKDLLQDILGADQAVVETIAHAAAGLLFFPDADCICDVGGVDVKIMILRQGTVSDFRLNSQCSSGNGAFLQGVADRFGISLDDIAEYAFQAESIPQLSMGCGVFLQSDIVNQQRKGWQAHEILAGLCAVLPQNVWIYAGSLSNLRQVGRKYILQGGTHKNLAVVKAQVDFIRSKVPDAEVVVHPYSGEAGAIGAALVALDRYQEGHASEFRGFQAIEALSYITTTSPDTVCHWCPVSCKRTFVDVQLNSGEGRPWSKIPLAHGWKRVIVNNSCPKGTVEGIEELRIIKTHLENIKSAFPNIAESVRKQAFRSEETVAHADRNTASAQHLVYASILDRISRFSRDLIRKHSLEFRNERRTVS